MDTREDKASLTETQVAFSGPSKGKDRENGRKEGMFIKKTRGHYQNLGGPTPRREQTRVEGFGGARTEADAGNFLFHIERGQCGTSGWITPYLWKSTKKKGK